MRALVSTFQTDPTPGRGIATLSMVMLVSCALVVAGCATSTPATSKPSAARASSDGGESLESKYDKALDAPDNLLSRPSSPLIPAGRPSSGTLRKAVDRFFRGFNWVTEKSTSTDEVRSYVHDTFAARDAADPSRWIPRLVYKATVSDDQKTYTLHLREDVKWHTPMLMDASQGVDGWLAKERKLTAEDCVFFFELVKNPHVESGALKFVYQDLEGAEVIDENTFRVTWKKKNHITRALTLGAYPMPKWLFTRKRDGSLIDDERLGSKFNRHWASMLGVGTGPYRLVEYESGQRVRLELNPHYWGSKPAIDTIEIEVLRDPNNHFERLRAGKLDIAKVPPAPFQALGDEQAGSLEAAGLEHTSVAVPIYYYIGWNMDGPFFADRRVRQAMTHALNRRSIIETMLRGFARPLTGPLPPSHPGYDSSIEPLAFDLERAKELLAEAGWTDSDGDGVRDKLIEGTKKNFSFTMHGYNKPISRRYLGAYKRDLAKIGVQMQTKFVDWRLMQQKMTERSFDAFTGGWALDWSADPYQTWHSSQADVTGGANRVGFRNARADEIIERLRRTFEPQKRSKLLREFHRIVHREQPYTFFYQAMQPYAWRSKLKNVTFRSIRPIDLSFSWYVAQPDEAKADNAGPAAESP